MTTDPQTPARTEHPGMSPALTLLFAVAAPILNRLANHPSRFRNAYLRTFEAICMAAMPLAMNGNVIVVGDHRQMPPIVQTTSARPLPPMATCHEVPLTSSHSPNQRETTSFLRASFCWASNIAMSEYLA